MSKCLHSKRWLIFLTALVVAAAGWAGNRLDFFSTDVGDEDDAFDDVDFVAHTFISDHFQPFRMFLFIDNNDDFMVPLFNLNQVTLSEVIAGFNSALGVWNDVEISMFEWEEGIVPTHHTRALFPNQQILSGMAALDGWNLITFQDTVSPSFFGFNGDPGIVSATALQFKFWRDFELDSFLELPAGMLFLEPLDPPGGGVNPGDPPQLSIPSFLIDFDQDGFSDILIEARDYEAGEVIEADIWFDPTLAWVQWPEDPSDLDATTTSGGTVTREDTLGTPDIQAIGTHELGHIMGLTHSNLERATMYFAIKQGFNQGFDFPTDIWEMRQPGLDDEIGLSLIYPKMSSDRGSIAGMVLDGRNFDGLSDETSGVIDAVLYGTLYLVREMTTGTIPALVADKTLITTGTGVTQFDLDTSPALYAEMLAEIQTGNDIVMAQRPNPLTFMSPVSDVNGVPMHIEASPQFVMPGVPPFDRYMLWLDNVGTYRNDNAGVNTDNLSLPFDFFFGWQPIPTEFYGGSTDPNERRLLGPDSPLPLSTTTGTLPLITQTGDDPSSFVFVAVQPGRVTGGILIYTNTGGLPAGVTPTPFPLASPTPANIGDTTFTPDEFSDDFVAAESEWGVAAAVGDVDNDGDDDVYICNATSAETSGTAISLVNRLLINTLVTTLPDGTLVTDRANARLVDETFGINGDGVGGQEPDRMPFDVDMSFGAVMADFNLDGYLDIYVSNAQSISQGILVNGAQNRLYLNRGAAQPGYFDDVTDDPRTDLMIGIPGWFTSTILPGILNEGPFVYGDRSTRSAAGDLDGDGDVDIVVSNLGLDGSIITGTWDGPMAATGQEPTTGFYPTPPPNGSNITLSYSERILINHTNDFDPNTRGFYFTDETLGMDALAVPGWDTGTSWPLILHSTFGEWTTSTNLVDLQLAADRMPPTYPLIWDPQDGSDGPPDLSMSFEVVLAPLAGDGSLDIAVINRDAGGGTKLGTEFVYENVDVDNDGVADGYFRQINFGSDFVPVTATNVIPPPGTVFITPINPLENAGLYGIGGLNIANGDRGDTPDADIIAVNDSDSYGGVAVDINYHAHPQLLMVNGTEGNLLINFRRPFEVLYGDVGTGLGGQSLFYGTELDWTGPAAVLSSPLQMTPNLARHVAAADFDHDGDQDFYIGYSSDRPENVAGGVPVPNEYHRNSDRFGLNYTNVTLTTTSGTGRGTHYVEAFDFDLDSDPDILMVNARESNGVLLNLIYLAAPNPLDPADNPLFYDATPEYLPPFYGASTGAPFSSDSFANFTVNAVTGDLTGDGLPELVEINGALFTGAGDSTQLYINHGESLSQSTPVFAPIDSPYPRMVAGPSTVQGLGNPIQPFHPPTLQYALNRSVPGFDAVLVDLDLDGDYDIFESTLATSPVVYVNMDSDELIGFPHTLHTDLEWTRRILNSVADDDFLGDGIMLIAEQDDYTYPPQFSVGVYLPELRDPGEVTSSEQKKWQNRRLAYTDVDTNGTVDILIANGIPGSGAPNVLLLNGVDGSPPGVLKDATETNLPTQTFTGPGGAFQAGIDDDTVDIAAADFDNDGFPELIFLNSNASGNTSPTRYLDNDGLGHFADVPFVLPDFGRRNPSTIAVADFDRKGDATEDINGNGILDSGEDTNGNGRIDWWDTTETEDINSNGILDFGEDGLAPFDANGVLDSADLNGDGVITPRQPGVFDASWDIYIAFVDGPDMLFLNSLPGPLGAPFALIDVTATNLPGNFAASNGTDVGDVDLDGDIDIVVAITTQATLPHVLLLQNNGIGGFRNAANELPGNFSILIDLSSNTTDWFHETAMDVDLLDVDADGDLDMHVSYLGMAAVALTAGGINAFYVNRTIGTNFNTLNRFKTYQAPYLVKLAPRAGLQGTMVSATVYGQKFGSEIGALEFGDGVQVGPITRIAPNAYSAMLFIADNATPGTRDVTAIFKDGKVSQLPSAFTVVMRKTSARPVWDLYR